MLFDLGLSFSTLESSPGKQKFKDVTFSKFDWEDTRALYRLYGSPNVSSSRSRPDSPSGFVFADASSVDEQMVY